MLNSFYPRTAKKDERIICASPIPNNVPALKKQMHYRHYM